ncbi:MAG: NAD(P)H-dependent oxidoreductase subunit E, partial [Planctomycetota bacterium]
MNEKSDKVGTGAEDIALTEVDEIVGALGRAPASLIPILQALQDKYHYLPETALKHLCAATDITPADIAGVSTFYSQFRFRPAGLHTIKVCIGTACHVKGGPTVFDAFKRVLGIPDQEDTDADRLFTVEKVACLGCCMLAPAVQIDDVIYGHLTTQTVPRILQDFLNLGPKDTAAVAGESHRPAGEVWGEIRVCLCSSCLAAGAGKVAGEIQAQIEAAALPATVKVVGCTGFSHVAPLLDIVLPDGSRFRYGRVESRNVREILLHHFRPVGFRRRVQTALSRALERMLTDEVWAPVTRFAVDVRDQPDGECEHRQRRLATEHAGRLDPLDLQATLQNDGFKALKACMAEGTPDGVIERIDSSGLRGRGGAGFPTGRKWRAVRDAPGREKRVICNGDEGDPGAFMDRMLLESFPYRVIEGAAIAAWAVGADEGIFYVRAEYPLAIRRLREALARCRAEGILGERLMGTGPPLRLRVVEGAGAFVCGEETALMEAVEGRRGTPRFRPPYPSEKGLGGMPTLINNVETFALVPWILQNGPEAFAGIGTEESKGTK